MPPEISKTRKLTPRNYLGEGYFHWFRNNSTNEVIFVECTKEEYESLGLPNAGPATLEGHTWISSAGGTVKVDTPTGFLGVDEYAVKGGEVVVRTANEELFLPLDAVDAEDNLDESKIVKQ